MGLNGWEMIGGNEAESDRGGWGEGLGQKGRERGDSNETLLLGSNPKNTGWGARQSDLLGEIFLRVDFQETGIS